VSLSTVILYFATRDALRRAVVEELERWAVALAQSVHRRATPADTALYEHLVRFADYVDERPEYAAVWFGWSMAVDDPLWKLYLRLQNRIERLITATVRRGQREGTIARELSPEDVALIVIGAGYVIAQANAAGRPRRNLERLVRTLVDSVRRVVANDTRRPPDAGGSRRRRGSGGGYP
jgi:AcrR family transcriptional regulator